MLFEKDFTEQYLRRAKTLREELTALKFIEPNLQLQPTFCAILCHDCETIAFTRSNHDMNSCRCGLCNLDGGNPSNMRIIAPTGKYDIINSFKIQNKDLRKKYKDLQNEAIQVKELGENIIKARLKELQGI